MKVLLLTVRSDYGGWPRHVDQLVNGLPEFVDLYMAYPREGEPYAKIWERNEIIRGRFYLPYRKFSVSKLASLIRFVKDNRIDIVHSHGNGAGIYSRFLKIFCPKVKIVHTYHGISDVYSSKIKFLSSIIIGRMLSPLADKYICVSDGERRMAIDRKYSKANNTVVIYNGIPNPEYIGCRDIHHKPIRVITISRFDYQKNMDSTFRIAKYFVDSDDIRFVWVGDGEDRERLEQQAEAENVPIDFIGFTKYPMKYLIDSDIYLSTSRFEGLPYALIEAASVGLPIVATNVKGNNEVVKDDYNGYLFQLGNEGDIDAIKCLEKIMGDNKKYQQMSDNSVTLYKQNFTEEKMIKSLVNIYQGMVNDEE